MTLAIVGTELLLDAWPVLEWLKGREPSRTEFRKLVDDAMAGLITLSMSRINYGEVVYSIAKAFPKERVESALRAFNEIDIVFYSVDDALVDEAAALKSIYPISYADAFAAALAIRRNLPLVTGDHEFLALEPIGLKLHWVGR